MCHKLWIYALTHHPQVLILCCGTPLLRSIYSKCSMSPSTLRACSLTYLAHAFLGLLPALDPIGSRSTSVLGWMTARLRTESLVDTAALQNSTNCCFSKVRLKGSTPAIDRTVEFDAKLRCGGLTSIVNTALENRRCAAACYWNPSRCQSVNQAREDARLEIFDLAFPAYAALSPNTSQCFEI